MPMTWWCKDFHVHISRYRSMTCDSDSLYELNECRKFYFQKNRRKKIKRFARLLYYINPTNTQTHTCTLISSKNLKWQQLAFTSLVNFICFPIFNVYKYFIAQYVCVCVRLFLCVIGAAALTITILPNLYPTHKTSVCLYVYLVIYNYVAISRYQRVYCFAVYRNKCTCVSGCVIWM